MTESEDVRTVFFKRRKETGVFRKPCPLNRASIDDEGNKGLVRRPKSFSTPFLTQSRTISRSEATNSPNDERIVRRARRRASESSEMDRVATGEGDSTPPEGVTIEGRIARGARSRTSSVGTRKSGPLPEDKIIDTTSLRRFALEKLPKESALREIILLEEKELTPEQFLDRLQIWLRLMDREN